MWFILGSKKSKFTYSKLWQKKNENNDLEKKIRTFIKERKLWDWNHWLLYLGIFFILFFGKYLIQNFYIKIQNLFIFPGDFIKNDKKKRNQIIYTLFLGQKIFQIILHKTIWQTLIENYLWLTILLFRLFIYVFYLCRGFK